MLAGFEDLAGYAWRLSGLALVVLAAGVVSGVVLRVVFGPPRKTLRQQRSMAVSGVLMLIASLAALVVSREQGRFGPATDWHFYAAAVAGAVVMLLIFVAGMSGAWNYMRLTSPERQ